MNQLNELKNVLLFLLITYSITFLLNQNVCKSQNLEIAAKSSYYNYIYNLSNEKVIEIFNSKRHQLDLQIFHSAIDSFPRGTKYNKELPLGHYLFANAFGNKFEYSYKSVNTIFVSVLNNYHDLSIAVYDKKSNDLVTNAVVKLNDKIIPFDQITKTYTLFKNRKEGLLSVEVGNELLVTDLENESYWREGFFRKIGYSFPLKYIVIPVRNLSRRILYGGDYYPNSKKEKAKGYIAFNKPKYLPKDTVKFKAYLLNKRNNIIEKKVKIQIQEGWYNGNVSDLAVIEPGEYGGYIYQFPVSDTLKTDMNYNIHLVNSKNGKLYLKNNFYVEDYQLDETSYELRAGKEYTYYNGETIDIYTSGKDINGLSVMDGIVELVAKTDYITNFYASSVFIPEILWEHKQRLDPVGETKIIIPDSILPKAKFNIRINAKFTNSNNEIHNKTISVVYDGKEGQFEIELNKNILTCNVPQDSFGIENSGLYIGLKDRDTLFVRSIEYPFEEIINTNVSEHVFVHKDQQRSFFAYSVEDSISSSSYLHQDTVIFKLINPRSLKVKYNIYKGKENEIERGECSDFEWSIYNPKGDSWYISYQYFWAGESKQINNSVHSYEKNLNVKIDQPQDIDPGEYVDVKIKVTDYKEQPVKNVNLTVGSINSQFDDRGYPNLPYMGKYKKGRKIYNSSRVEDKTLKRFTTMNNDFRSRLSLDTMLYYKFRYPENGIYLNYNSIEANNAQFFPHLYNRDYQVDIVLIYIDEKLAYYSGVANPYSRYSIISDEGYHNIVIRTRTKKYTIDSLFLRNGYKLDLSLSVQNLPKNIKVKNTRQNLTDEELSEIKDRMILLKNNFNGKSAYVWQGDKVYALENTSDNYFLLGPFHHDTIQFAIRDEFQTNFLFQPFSEFLITRDSIVVDNAMDRYVWRWYNKRFNREISPGQIALPLSEIKLKYVKTKWDEIILSDNYSVKIASCGDLQIKYEGDSIFKLTRLVPYSIDFHPKYYSGNTNKIYNLNAGYYQLAMITSNENVLVMDSIFIQSDGLNYYRLDDLSYIPNDSLLFLNGSYHYPQWKFPIPAVYLNYGKSTLDGKSTIKGKVVDDESGEPLPFANVVLMRADMVYSGVTTDFDGNYTIKGVTAGMYDLKVTYIGYNTTLIMGVPLADDQIRFLDIEMNSDGASLAECCVVAYSIPLINRDETVSGGSVTAEEIMKMPNRSANAVATTVGGVSSYDRGKGNLRGAIEDQEVIFIDGVKIINDDNQSYQQYLNNKLNIRQDFKDYAYWKPELITDELGQASFSIKFPDNITKWKTFVLAMDGKKHSGIGLTETRAKKTLVSQLSVPRFLIYGDQSESIGKILNYRNEPQEIQTTFSIDDHLLNKTDTIIGNTLLEYFSIDAEEKDSLILKYTMQQKDGFSDGEIRIIPVFPKGTEESIGHFYILEGDTSFNVTLDSSFNNLEIYATQSTLQFMLDEIEKLKDYPHFCMEQCASKLLGFLAEEKIKQQLAEPFRHKSDIKKMIKKLEQGQNDNGSWGWWANTAENIQMTAYITKVLAIASNSGYESEALFESVQLLSWYIDILKGENLLYTLDALSSTGISIDCNKYLKSFSDDTLTSQQKLLITKIRQDNNLEYSIENVLSMKNESIFDNYYWGVENNIYSDNSIDLTILAYNIIEKYDSLNSSLNKIRRYLIDQTGKNSKINTYQSALMLQAILPGAMKEKSQSFSNASLEITTDEVIAIDKFPFYKRTDSDISTIQIEKNGSNPVYFTCYSKKWNQHPEPVDSNFIISSWFEIDGKKTEQLKAGENTLMKIKVDVIKKANYVMIEIPIPAGCSYGEKISGYNFKETHREYYKNKTIVYCEKLEIGEHIFTIRLEPRYNGKYTLNPVKVELMYFPIFFGRNAIENVRVY